MTRQPSFDGVRVKVERAKEHIRDLEASVQEFRRIEPYKVVAYDEPDTGDLVFKVEVSAQPPLRWGAIAGDVIHNLRASLDVLVWQLVLVNERKPDRMRTGFPISESAHEFKSKGLRKVKGVPDEAVHLIKAAKPYKGGNDALWRLHHLDIRDKHRLLIPVGDGTYTNLILDFARIFDNNPDVPPELIPSPDVSMPIALKPADRLYPLKDGAELFRVPVDGREMHMNMNPKFTFEIAFGEDEIIQGEPLIPALHELVQFVEGFVEPFRLLFSRSNTS